jgi:hypothetical protein
LQPKYFFSLLKENPGWCGGKSAEPVVDVKVEQAPEIDGPV